VQICLVFLSLLGGQILHLLCFGSCSGPGDIETIASGGNVIFTDSLTPNGSFGWAIHLSANGRIIASASSFMNLRHVCVLFLDSPCGCDTGLKH